MSKIRWGLNIQDLLFLDFSTLLQRCPFISNSTLQITATVIFPRNNISIIQIKKNVFPLTQAGLYRLSGAERTVKELKEKFLRSKTVPVLSKVDDIHAVTGLLKDFLRNLKEPLLTFRLNRSFMDAAGKSVFTSLGFWHKAMST